MEKRLIRENAIAVDEDIKRSALFKWQFANKIIESCENKAIADKFEDYKAWWSIHGTSMCSFCDKFLDDKCVLCPLKVYEEGICHYAWSELYSMYGFNGLKPNYSQKDFVNCFEKNVPIMLAAVQEVEVK